MKLHKGLDTDFVTDIPGYRAILKAVLKSQILTLVDQLAEQTGEESMILMANVTDRTLCQLGSPDGKDFLDGKDEIKTEYLKHCLMKQKQRNIQGPVINRDSEDTDSHSDSDGDKPDTKKRLSSSRKRPSTSAGRNFGKLSRTSRAGNKDGGGSRQTTRNTRTSHDEGRETAPSADDSLERDVLIIKEEVGDDLCSETENTHPSDLLSSVNSIFASISKGHGRVNKIDIELLTSENDTNNDYKNHTEKDTGVDNENNSVNLPETSKHCNNQDSVTNKTSDNSDTASARTNNQDVTARTNNQGIQDEEDEEEDEEDDEEGADIGAVANQPAVGFVDEIAALYRTPDPPLSTYDQFFGPNAVHPTEDEFRSIQREAIYSHFFQYGAVLHTNTFPKQHVAAIAEWHDVAEEDVYNVWKQKREMAGLDPYDTKFRKPVEPIEI